MDEEALSNFDPSTPTEMVLLQEIRRLRVALQIAGQFELLRPFNVDAVVAVSTLQKEWRMYPAASVQSFIDPSARLRVRLEAHFKDGTFGSQYMVNEYPRTKFQAADLVMELHKTQMQNIAGFLKKGISEAA